MSDKKALNTDNIQGRWIVCTDGSGYDYMRIRRLLVLWVSKETKKQIIGIDKTGKYTCTIKHTVQKSQILAIVDDAKVIPLKEYFKRVSDEYNKEVEKLYNKSKEKMHNFSFIL
jgi:hypothetical protein